MMTQPSLTKASAARLRRDIEPRIGELDFHRDVGDDRFDAEIERSEARDDFGVLISADIADLPVAVAILIEGGIELARIG
jgi:hypothetical protein